MEESFHRFVYDCCFDCYFKGATILFLPLGVTIGSSIPFCPII